MRHLAWLGVLVTACASGEGSGTSHSSSDSASATSQFGGESVEYGPPTVSTSATVQLLTGPSLTRGVARASDIAANARGVFLLGGDAFEPVVESWSLDLAQRHTVDATLAHSASGLFATPKRLFAIEGNEQLISWPVEQNGDMGEVDIRLANPMASIFLAQAAIAGTEVYLSDSVGDTFACEASADGLRELETLDVNAGLTLDTALDDDHLFVATQGEVQRWAREDHRAQAPISQSTLGSSPQDALAIAVDANFFYVANRTSGAVQVFFKEDMSPAATTQVSDPRALAVWDRQLYVVDGASDAIRSFTIAVN